MTPELPSTPGYDERSEVQRLCDATPKPRVTQLGEHPGLKLLSPTSPCLTLKFSQHTFMEHLLYT